MERRFSNDTTLFPVNSYPFIFIFFILPVLVVTAVMNVFFIDGEPLLEIGFITVTYEAVESAIFMILRIVLLIAGSSLLTYTTSPIALTDALERLMSPLKKIKVPVHELAMMMTIALRFIPTLIDETDRIMSAQKSRGADWETGKLMDRAKALLPIFIPLFVVLVFMSLILPKISTSASLVAKSSLIFL